MDEDWVIAVTVASAVSFKGTQEEAVKHKEAFIEELRTMFKTRGFGFKLEQTRTVSREHALRSL